MIAAHVHRPSHDTLDYANGEETTDLIVPLVRRSTGAREIRASLLKTRYATPMIVDKKQLVEIARVLRPIPETVPSRVPRLSGLVLESRVHEERRARRATWLVRIALLAMVEVVMGLASSPGAVRRYGAVISVTVGAVLVQAPASTTR